MSKTVVVPLSPGFEETEAVSVIDTLRRAELDVTVAGLEALEVDGGHGLTIRTDRLLAEVGETPDAVVLPGGMPNAKTLGESAAVRALVGRVVSANGVVAAICAAPAMALAGFGVLDGKKATCYPGFEKHFPASAIFSEERVVVDGALVTSRGPGTALEFALAVVELLADTSTAEDLAGGMLIRR